MPTLHLHLDESGDWSFTPRGSRYFVIAAAWTYHPQPLAEALTALRFRLVREGHSIECFHAAPDKQDTRDAVVRTLLAHDEWSFAAVVIEKCKVNPVLREPHRFFPQFAGSLLRFIFGYRLAPGTDRVLVYADTLPMDSHRKREGALKAMKTTCAQELPVGVTHHVFSHRSMSNTWLQAVDYCCWAVARKWERGDPRTYDQLCVRLTAPELEVMRHGQTRYY